MVFRNTILHSHRNELPQLEDQKEACSTIDTYSQYSQTIILVVPSTHTSNSFVCSIALELADEEIWQRAVALPWKWGVGSADHARFDIAIPWPNQLDSTVIDTLLSRERLISVIFVDFGSNTTTQRWVLGPQEDEWRKKPWLRAAHEKSKFWQSHDITATHNNTVKTIKSKTQQ